MLNLNLETTTTNGVTCTANGDGTYTLNGTATAGTSFQLFTRNPKIKAGTYKLVGVKNGSYQTYSLRAYNSNNNILKVDLGSGITFTTTEDLVFSFFINISNGITLNNVVFKPMLTIDTSLTYNDFIPHQSQTLPFTLSQGQKMYKGDYLADDGIHHVRGEEVFDGSDDEGWFKSGTTNVDRFVIEKNMLVNIVPLSNCFIGKTTSTYEKGTFYNNQGNQLVFNYSDYGTTTLEEWKNWLAENSLKVEYELAEEVIDPYTPTQQEQYNAIKKAISYKDTTIITLTSSDAEPLTNVVAVADMSNINNELETIKARLDLIEE